MAKSISYKLPAHAQAFKSLQAYQQNIATGKELVNPAMNIHIAELSKFFNKNGTLSKRALRSKKAQKEFTEALNKFKSSPEYSVTARKKAATEERKKRSIQQRAEKIKNQGLRNNPNLSNDEAALKADKIFRDTEVGALFSGYNYYELVLDIADNTEISATEIVKIFNNIYKMRELEAPDDSMEALKTDEANEILRIISQIDLTGLNTDELMDIIWQLIKADEG